MFKSKITKIGELADNLLNEDNMIILFYDNAPKDLHEISVLHSKEEADFEAGIGDRMIIGSYEYYIIDIGRKAKETMKTLGHCTLIFTENADMSVNLPGEVILLGAKPKKLDLGMTIEVIK